MGKKAQISLSQLKKAAGPEVKRLLAEVAEAINQAPDGAVIDGSEEAVREAMARFRERIYELGIQMRSDAAKAAFSPSDLFEEREASAEQREPAGLAPDGQRDDPGGPSGVRGSGRGDGASGG